MEETKGQRQREGKETDDRDWAVTDAVCVCVYVSVFVRVGNIQRYKDLNKAMFGTSEENLMINMWSNVEVNT